MPTISVAHAAVQEGADGTRPLVFTVMLDKPAAGAVTVAYATADGSATAGSDYLAAAGTLRFEAGETSRTVTVAVQGDAIVEADEALVLRLSSPSGASLANAEAIGTIRNDDVALPVLQVGDAHVAEGDLGRPAIPGTAPGFFSTAGNQIVDAAGNPVKITAVSWFGMETGTQAPHGLWVREWHEMMREIAAEGFNTIRLPFSSELLHTDAAPYGIDFNLNPDLAGLSGLGIMDKVVQYAGELGLRIILDHHSNRIGVSVAEDGLWYRPGEAYTEDRWVQDWQDLAARYAGNPTVIGADLHSEPWAATWGGGGENDWHRAAERAGNAVLAANPDWLVFVEGVFTHDDTGYWWGGNLAGVRDNPVELDVGNKLVYSAHDYPNSVFPQSWFQDAEFGDALAERFDSMWGYIYREGIAPVFLGEFGSRLEDPKDLVWLDKITAYLAGDFDADGTVDIPGGDQGISWGWWSWNPNSSDTGGILADDWRTVIEAKVAHLQPLLFDWDAAQPATPDDAHALRFTVTLSEAAAEAVLVDYATVAGSADTADFAPAHGTLRFEPGETSKVVEVAVTPDMAAEADETLSLVLSNPRGATLAQATGTGTVVNDDAAGPMPPPRPTEEGLDGVFTITDNWGSVFGAEVVVRNQGEDAVSGWLLRLNMPWEIRDIWSAEIVSHDETGYLIRNAAWNGALVEDGTTSFGFIGLGSGADAAGAELIF
ncbi:cellulase family glycosylhydrolase [Teichococcus deserti]|uniref:cellulase family glycosylhydrolase n=1 Tax=Teichococcus deserti TaxID=1817963 RepID=UPI001F619D52|nr:cellulase family glycosylhydrolase [Pseudoroseomonas deserti]